jgi:hypothetical protein
VYASNYKEHEFNKIHGGYEYKDGVPAVDKEGNPVYVVDKEGK